MYLGSIPPRVKEAIAAATWQERTPGLWVYHFSGDEDFYFSLEGWQVDRLTDE